MPPRLRSVPWHSFRYLSDNTRAREPVSRAVRVFWRRPAPRLLARLIASPLALLSFCSSRPAEPPTLFLPGPPLRRRRLQACPAPCLLARSPCLSWEEPVSSRAVAHLGRQTPLPAAPRLCGSRAASALPDTARAPGGCAAPCCLRAVPSVEGPARVAGAGSTVQAGPPLGMPPVWMCQEGPLLRVCVISASGLLETPPPVRMTVETRGHVMPS